MGIKIYSGVNFGPCHIGLIGSNQRLKMAVLGDTVNLSSGLCYYNRNYATTFIASESFKNLSTENILFRELDLIRIKGVQDPVPIFEVIV